MNWPAFVPRIYRSAIYLILALAMSVFSNLSNAQTCPFDDGNSSLAVEGLILTRYALGLTGAPLVASTPINAVDAPAVEATINCASCGLNITGNATLTVADATIISRKLAGFSGDALTDGLALGSGTRNTPAAVQSFLLSGCGTASGTVTTITAGTGLAGGTITTAGTVSIAPTYRLPQSCSNGQFPRFNATTSTWDCSTAVSGGVTGVATGPGLVGGPISSTGTISLAASQLLPTTLCATNQIIRWNGSAWVCTTLPVPPTFPTCVVGQVLRFSSIGTLECGNLPHEITTVDNTPGVGSHTSIAVGANGLPQISYRDDTVGTLKIASCTTPSCSGGVGKSTIDGVPDVGFNTSIAVPADGVPVISYFDATNDDLKVLKCGTPTCSIGSTKTAVDTVDLVGSYSSLAIGSDGFPVISYADTLDNNLKIVKCGNAQCNSGNVISTVDSVDDVGDYTSLAVPVDGLPIVSYYDRTHGDLKVLKCGDASCTSGNTITTVDTGGAGVLVGTFTSIATAPEFGAVVSYWDQTNASLKILKCGNNACNANNIITTVDTAGGQYSSIKFPPDGLPVVSYYAPGNQTLKVLKCGTLVCNTNNTISTVDGNKGSGTYSSLAVPADGLPVISYRYVDPVLGGQLKVLKCSNAKCAMP